MQDARAAEQDLESQLDLLIPPPLSRPRKLLIGSLVLALAVVASFLKMGGYLMPQPFEGMSFGSSTYMTTDESRGLVSATVRIPNNSQRTLRVTSVTLDAPGAELVDSQILFDPEKIGRDTDGGGLPVSIEPGADGFLVLWFRPLSCVDVAPPWGVAAATFDFGDGAFPPFSRTVRIDDDPVWEDGERSVALVGPEFVSGSGPLSLACEVLR